MESLYKFISVHIVKQKGKNDVLTVLITKLNTCESFKKSYPGRKLACNQCIDVMFDGFGLKFLGGGHLGGGGGSPAFRFLPRITSLFFGSDFLGRFGLIFGIFGVYEMK